MLENLTIREARQADHSGIFQICEVAFAPVFASFRDIAGPAVAPIAFQNAETEQREHLSKILAADSEYDVLVAEVDGELAGFVSFNADISNQIGEIDLNAVLPKFAGQGIGTMLYEHALEALKHAGCKVATVGTGGDDSHAPARRAYAKAGFDKAVPSVWYYKEL